MKERIALLTDSTCDLNPDVIARYGISVLPLKVIYKDRVYHDRVDITPQEVYARLAEEVPTTSTPSPFEAAEALTRLRDAGFTHVLAVHISEGLSTTANTVRLAARDIAHLTTQVIDSKSLSMGLGFMVEQAGRWLQEKGDFASLVSRTQALVNSSNLYYAVRTLEYLRRGGRINTVAAAVAGILDLKPIISINDEGKYFSFRRVRGRGQSLREILELARKGVAAGLTRVAVMHGDADKEAEALFDQVKALPGVTEVVFGQIGPVLVVHTGPGLVGVALSPA